MVVEVCPVMICVLQEEELPFSKHIKMSNFCQIVMVPWKLHRLRGTPFLT
jgi:hypothetical protein